MKYLAYPCNYISSRMCTQAPGQCRISHQLPHIYKAITGCFLPVKAGLVSLFLLQPCYCVNLTVGSAGRKAQRPHHEGDGASHQALLTTAPLLFPAVNMRGQLGFGPVRDWGKYGCFTKCSVPLWEQRHTWAGLHQKLGQQISPSSYSCTQLQE